MSTATAYPGRLNFKLHPHNQYTVTCTYDATPGSAYVARIVGLDDITATVVGDVVSFTIPVQTFTSSTRAWELVDTSATPDRTDIGGSVVWSLSYDGTPSALAVNVLTQTSVAVAVTVLPGGGGGGSGTVTSVVAGTNITVDSTDPANPVVAAGAGLATDAEVTAAVAAEALLARNADNLTSGTVADVRIAATIARDSEVTAAVAALSSVYQPLDSDLTALAGLSGVRGDIIYRDASQWQRLAKGTSGYVLTQGTNDPSWAATVGDRLGLTPTAVKTTTYTAAAGDLVKCDSSGGIFTVTLPTTPADGSVIEVKQVAATATTVTVACGGSAVFNRTSGATTTTLPLIGQAVLVQYQSTGDIWIIVANDAPLSQLDSRYVDETAGGREGYVSGGNSSTAATISLATGNLVSYTLTGNCTFTFPTVSNDGAYSFTLVLVQDATGSRAATWPAAVKWPSATAPTLTATATKRDVFVFTTYDGGTTWLGFTSGQNFT